MWRITIIYVLLPLCTAACTLDGVWTDTNGGVARITQNGDQLSLVSLSGGGSWQIANGTVNGRDILVIFGTALVTGQSDLATCHQIQWSNQINWVKDAEDVDVVYIVSMTHLDVGFTNTAEGVCRTYFNKYFPAAIKTANDLKARGGEERFIYSSWPWLVLEYLDGAAGCTPELRTPDQIKALEDAIVEGDIAWNAMPLNYFPELSDPDTFNYGLTLREELNARFGNEHGTLCGKHTDVPGLSQSVVPRFHDHGVKALHIGFNYACMVAEVPNVFKWQHIATNTTLITMVERGYGDLVTVPNLRSALVFHYTSDNGMPPSSEDVIAKWATVRKQFKNARLVASTLDAFAADLVAHQIELPTVTEEIGDSWLYGAPADPYKVSAYRAIRRVRNHFVKDQALTLTDLRNFDRRLLNVPEHNWGLSVGQYLPALRSVHGNWSNVGFHSVRNRSDYRLLESGWTEKRGYLIPQPNEQSLKSKNWTVFLSEIEQTLHSLRARAPATENMQEIRLSQAQECPSFTLQFSEIDGAIVSLVDRKTGREFCDERNALGRFKYQTFSLDDFDRFNRQYNPGCGPPCGDFSKEGMNSANPESRIWTPHVVQVLKAQDSCQFLVTLKLDDKATVFYGAPSIVHLNIDATSVDGKLGFTLTWLNKTATRLSEAMWLSFWPLVAQDKYTLDVIGEQVDPWNVAINGTQLIHAVWSGVSHPDVEVETLDVPLVVLGDDLSQLLQFNGRSKPPRASGGLNFNLYNNLWGTAFPQWYDDDGVARFTLTF